jgi:hypothetical protein
VLAKHVRPSKKRFNGFKLKLHSGIVADEVFSPLSLQGGSSAPRNTYPGAAPPHIKGNQRPSGPAMTSPAGAISGAPYRGGAGWTQGYAPAQQTYRYTAPLAAQPAYAYTQHTTTTVSLVFRSLPFSPKFTK